MRQLRSHACYLVLLWLAAAAVVDRLHGQLSYDALDIRPKWNGSAYEPGKLRFCDSNAWPTSTDCVGVSSAANSGAYDVRLPVDQGLSGQALVTDGANPAQLSWAANSPGGCPAGGGTHLQYNDSGNCGASGDYFITKTGARQLTLNTEVTTAGVVSIVQANTHSGSASNLGSIFRGLAARGTTGAPTALASGDRLTVLGSTGHDGTSFNSGAAFYFRTSQAWTPTAHGSEFVVQTVGNGQTTPTDRWAILASRTMFPGADGAYDFGLNNFRIKKGYFDNANSERFEFENPAHTAHMSAQFTAGGLLEVQQTDNTPAWRIDNTDNEITTYGVQRPDADGSGKIGKQDSFEYTEAHVKSYIADNAFVVQSSENAEFQTCNSTTFKWPICTVTGRWHAVGGFRDAGPGAGDRGRDGDRDKA